jgi:outer membrane protein assembly factor BamB
VAQFSAATGAEEWRVPAHERVRDLAALPGRWVLLGAEGAWCLDAQGKPCWRAEREDGATDVSPRLIPVRHSAPANAAGGAAELPVTLLMWHGKSLAAVDPANGDASWRCSVDGARAIVAGLDCFVVCQSGGMSVHSLSDGTIRAWIDGQPFSPEGLAAAGSGRFLWGDADGTLRAFDGKSLFRYEGPSSHAHRHPLPIVPAPAQAADLLLAVIDGSVLARVDAKAGAVREARTAADAINGWDWLQEIEWAADPSAMKPAPAEPLPLVDLWRVPLASGPALGTSRGIVANSQRVVAAAGGRIVCLDSNSGRKIWEAEVGRPDSCWEPGTVGTDLVAGVSRVSGAIEFVLLDAQSGVELQRLRCEAPAVETAAPFGWNVNAWGAVIFCGNLIWCIEAAADAVPPTN